MYNLKKKGGVYSIYLDQDRIEDEYRIEEEKIPKKINAAGTYEELKFIDISLEVKKIKERLENKVFTIKRDIQQFIRWNKNIEIDLREIVDNTFRILELIDNQLIKQINNTSITDYKNKRNLSTNILVIIDNYLKTIEPLIESIKNYYYTHKK